MDKIYSDERHEFMCDSCKFNDPEMIENFDIEQFEFIEEPKECLVKNCYTWVCKNCEYCLYHNSTKYIKFLICENERKIQDFKNIIHQVDCEDGDDKYDYKLLLIEIHYYNINIKRYNEELNIREKYISGVNNALCILNTKIDSDYNIFNNDVNELIFDYLY